MLTSIEPATIDFLFTFITSTGLLGLTALTLLALPWSDEEIDATEHTFCSLLQLPPRQARSRTAR